MRDGLEDVGVGATAIHASMCNKLSLKCQAPRARVRQITAATERRRNGYDAAGGTVMPTVHHTQGKGSGHGEGKGKGTGTGKGKGKAQTPGTGQTGGPATQARIHH